MSALRLTRQIVAPILAAAGLAGCGDSPTDGAPVDAEAASAPVPDVNPQGLFRSISVSDED